MDTVLQVKDLTIAIGNASIVKAIDFDIKTGETVGLLGPSGCGKSMTALAIMGLLEGVTVSGEILFNGVNLLELPENQMQRIRGKKVSIVFQEPMTALNPTMSIGKQIAEVLVYHEKLTYRQAKEKAIQLLELVGIDQADKRVSQYPHQFSGGMRQRVLIAMAIACHPDLIIADEPTTALDNKTQKQILDLLTFLCREENCSLLLITHDREVAKERCHTIYKMERCSYDSLTRGEEYLPQLSHWTAKQSGTKECQLQH